jgi:hypothetical protein
MNGVRAGAARDVKNEIAAQIRLACSRRPQAVRLVGGENVESGAIRIGEDGHRRQAEFAARAEDAQRNLAAVGYEDFAHEDTEYGQQAACAKLRKKQKPSPQRGLLRIRFGAYCITTPFTFSLAFSSLALRAPMALWTQSCATSRSALRAASFPHSRSALRRDIRFRYCIASS